MDNRYIKVPGIYNKIKQAEEEGAVLYIHALGGYGKTAAVEYYYRNKAHLVLNGVEGILDTMPAISGIRQSVVIVDNISCITDTNSRSYICELLNQYENQLILIGRTPLPKWVRTDKSNKRFLPAMEGDLALDDERTMKLLASYDIKVTPAQAQHIAEIAQGHPVTIEFVAHRMADGKAFDAEVIEQVRMDLYVYCDHAFYDTWDNELKQTLLPMAEFESFTLRMIEIITGCANVDKLIERALTLSQTLVSDGNGRYQMRSILRDYLRHKQKTTFSKAQKNNIYNNAGLYYQLNDELEQALYYYDKCDNKEKIAELLIKNATLHPGNGHYYETRNYYFKLANEQVEASPTLMAGLSMLHSLLMQTQQSEEWYNKLRDFEHNSNNGNNERREAKIRLAYLDIALPHRGSTKVSILLKNVALLCTNYRIKMPEFSVTSNMPSVMSGGKDFCEWSNNGREIARMLKVPVELVLGKFAVGLVNISLAESFFEKDDTDAYEIMSMLNRAYTMADTKGKPEMCFAAISIMARVHISRRQPQLAYAIVSDFHKKMLLNKQNQLIPNIQAFLVWMELLTGNIAAAQKWLLEEAPNENMDFNILERYRYMVKIKVYIVLGRLEEAVALTERLSIYYEEYGRNYNQIEVGLLRAILQYRLRIGNWENSLKEALHKAKKYEFIRVVSEYGIALVPLLDKVGALELDASYLERIITATNKMAEDYPAYLLPLVTLKEPLTDTEQKILALLCTNATLEDIARSCDISYNTVRYHNKNIYRKLNVQNRAQAKITARQLGLEVI